MQLVTSIIPQLSKFWELPYRQPPYNSRYWGHPLHNLCSYPSKLKPAIAHILIRYFTEPGDVVLDPFSGVGTIPLAACLEGRTGIGIDLNPLAYWATLSKTNVPQAASIQALVSELTAQLAHIDVTDIIRQEHYEMEIQEFFHEQSGLNI
ncbi:DNA methylase [Neomoorella glycerini]|uniref:DNA methylase n=1 Tax=Neomoorella glycerini TaxID=55779 RepID=A0A6I5ZNK3_9FIRM|nr:DNA methyltransferase [Moorella glycerini]QGP91195.1 DNA methylase [Moorella glycerini]